MTTQRTWRLRVRQQFNAATPCGCTRQAARPKADRSTHCHPYVWPRILAWRSHAASFSSSIDGLRPPDF